MYTCRSATSTYIAVVLVCIHVGLLLVYLYSCGTSMYTCRSATSTYIAVVLVCIHVGLLLVPI